MANDTNGLSAGDVVTLNSGGPKMVIQSMHDDGATCVWFNQYGSAVINSEEALPLYGEQPSSYKFSCHALKKV